MITLREGEVIHFREMVRQQLLGDKELLRDAIAGREDPEIRWDVGQRLRLVTDLAQEIGLPLDKVDRRQGAARRRRRYRRGLSAEATRHVTVVSLVAFATAVIYGVSIALHGQTAPSLYAPVVIFARLRYGRFMGLLALLESMVAYVLTRPLGLYSDLHAVVAFATLFILAWVIRRETVF